jgi:hypothetical protein
VRRLTPVRKSALLASLLVVSSTGAASIVAGAEGGDRAPSESPYVNRCPSAQEVAEYAAETGQDYKPTITCRDPNDPANENASAPTPPAPPASPAEIAAFRRAYANNRHVAVGVDPDRAEGAITMTLVEGAPLPEEVDTPEEVDHYLGTDEK